MKVFVLTGSPHENGTSNTLVREFIKGAKEAGHEIDIYDVAKGNIHPCLGCDSYGMNGDCAQKDDGNLILQKILKSDCLVFATPVYYFGMSAQLKTMVDRFYARTTKIARKRLKAILITTSWDDDDDVMKAIEHHFKKLFDYMHFENRGMLLAKGSGTVQMIPSRYYAEAFNLGKFL